MIWAVAGLALGILVGQYVPFTYPDNFSLYISIGLLASMDSLLGAVRATMENKYDNFLFVSGFVSNTLLAAFLSYIGDKMGVPLYYAPIIIFGGRLFDNISYIRRIILKKWKS